MISLDIPDFGKLALDHIVMDFNGTLAVDGKLISGVAKRLRALSDHLTLHVVTADTFLSAKKTFRHLPVTVMKLESGIAQAEAKQDYVRNLGAEHVVAVGNGRNDRLMLASARLGIGVMLREGAVPATLTIADIVVADINDALDLLAHPLRLKATLRS